jgi:HSP20 family protein
MKMMTKTMGFFPGNGWRNTLLEMERMRREMARLSDALFDGVEQRHPGSGVFPLLNITEDAEWYYVRAELPGVEAEHLELQVSNNKLSISGERHLVSEGDAVQYHRRERKAGTFSRVVTLPGNIDADKISAKLDNGALTIMVGKSESAKPRQISVN